MKLMLIPLILVTMLACNNSRQASKQTKLIRANPKVLIYKTKNNYFDNVPVILSNDKTKIVSYPYQSDLKIGDSLRLPKYLENGYLLDNQGININTTFLKITYKEYSKLAEPLTLKQMYEMIIDNDPFLELYDCGFYSEYNDIIKELNTKILFDKLNEFTKIK